MEYREFGKTGKRISVLGFGAMRLPVIDEDLSRIDEPEAKRMIRGAIDRGVNYVDTAWPYHGGTSEAFTGRVLQDGYREKVFLATKLPSWLVEKEADMDMFLAQQLANLRTESIDFYLVHALNKTWWAKLRPLGLFDFLDRAKASGKVKHVGFSYHEDEPLFNEIVDGYDWDFCQIQFNYLDEDYQAGRAGFDYAAAKGMGVIIMEPLRGGALAADLPGDVQEAFDNSGYDRSPASWALNWVWNHPEAGTVLSGMSTMEQVEENLDLASALTTPALDFAEMDVVDRVKKLFLDRIKVNCTACQYCMPCPHGVNIPKNFTFYNDYAKFDSQSGQSRVRKMHGIWVKEEESASQCTECGECLEHCPQNIPIPDSLKEVVEVFGR